MRALKIAGILIGSVAVVIVVTALCLYVVFPLLGFIFAALELLVGAALVGCLLALIVWVIVFTVGNVK